MKTAAERFLTPNEYRQIENCIQAAEKRTAGEIVCLIQSASYHYPMANVIGATVTALPPALLLTELIGARFWIGPHNVWLFLGFFGLFFAAMHMWIDRWAAFKRRFISRREIEEEVEEAAVTAFFRRGLYRTRDATGVLLFISVFEHKVWLLADHGINAKVAPGQWDDIVARLTAGIRKKHAAAAICTAIDDIGGILEARFPAKADGRNELKNIIIDDGTP